MKIFIILTNILYVVTLIFHTSSQDAAYILMLLLGVSHIIQYLVSLLFLKKIDPMFRKHFVIYPNLVVLYFLILFSVEFYHLEFINFETFLPLGAMSIGLYFCFFMTNTFLNKKKFEAV